MADDAEMWLRPLAIHQYLGVSFPKPNHSARASSRKLLPPEGSLSFPASQLLAAYFCSLPPSLPGYLKTMVLQDAFDIF